MCTASIPGEYKGESLSQSNKMIEAIKGNTIGKEVKIFLIANDMILQTRAQEKNTCN